MVQVTSDPRKIWLAISELQNADSLPSDPGADRVLFWDDSDGAVEWAALADITAEGTPASGDYILLYGAEGDLRKVDWDDLPGAGAGISNLHEDLTPQLGANLDLNTFDITGTGDINITGTITSSGAMAVGANAVLTAATGQPLDADLTAIAALTTTAYGRSLLTLADDDALAAEINEFYQPLDSDLTAIAALTTTAGGRSVLAIADPGADRILAWDDSDGAMEAIALADLTDEATPATGDYILIYGAEGDLRKADWSTLPGAGGGISNVSEDVTPQLGGHLDLNSFNITGVGTIEAEIIGESIQAATVDSTPDRVADYVGSYDASADTGKKVLLSQVTGRSCVSTHTFSNTATLDIDLTPYTAYKLIKVHFHNVVPANDAASLWMRFSDDGGATFEADAADYIWNENYSGLSGTFDIQDTSDSEITLGSVSIGSTTYEQIPYLELTIVNPHASNFTTAYWHGYVYSTDGIAYHVQGNGSALVSGVSTDVRFLFSSGNIESGSATVEAML
jgi:hypothetical protein